MTSKGPLSQLIDHPRERIEVEYKDWLNLKEKGNKAKIARHAIALANHGGGYIVLGFAEDGQSLVSGPCPAGIPKVTQDEVNEVVSRHAKPAFHCELHFIDHQTTQVSHPIIRIPGNLSVPVISKRHYNGEIQKHRCYIRKSPPSSEEPTSDAEWRALLERCARANRDMLDAIRTIDMGQTEV